VWGWGIHDDRLWEPDTAEFMSYCDPSFTSLYHWESEFDVATELTSWDFEYGIDLEPQRPILRLVIAGGSATLRPSRMRGSLRTDEVLWIYGGRRVLASVYAQRNDVADSDATFLVAELPTVGLQGATRVVRVVGSERIEVPISAVIPPRQ
jgi:hypothetical protein